MGVRSVEGTHSAGLLKAPERLLQFIHQPQLGPTLYLSLVSGVTKETEVPNGLLCAPLNLVPCRRRVWLDPSPASVSDSWFFPAQAGWPASQGHGFFQPFPWNWALFLFLRHGSRWMPPSASGTPATSCSTHTLSHHSSAPGLASWWHEQQVPLGKGVGTPVALQPLVWTVPSP